MKNLEQLLSVDSLTGKRIVVHGARTQADDSSDPPPDQRLYYRNRQTGDLGWLVRRGGKNVIRLDRGQREELRDFRESSAGESPDWAAEHEPAKMTVSSCAKVAWAADQELCRALGLHGELVGEWLSLDEEVRIDWCKNGPGGDGPRALMFWAIMASLEEQRKA